MFFWSRLVGRITRLVPARPVNRPRDAGSGARRFPCVVFLHPLVRSQVSQVRLRSLLGSRRNCLGAGKSEFQNTGGTKIPRQAIQTFPSTDVHSPARESGHGICHLVPRPKISGPVDEMLTWRDQYTTLSASARPRRCDRHQRGPCDHPRSNQCGEVANLPQGKSRRPRANGFNLVGFQPPHGTGLRRRRRHRLLTSIRSASMNVAGEKRTAQHKFLRSTLRPAGVCAPVGERIGARAMKIYPSRVIYGTTSVTLRVAGGPARPCINSVRRM